MALALDKSGARAGAEVPRLGRYRLRYRIAQGGMASVFLARFDTTAGFGKWVALKTIHPHIATNDKFVTMFLDEARLAARLDHPNLCTVFDFGAADGTYFIAMEYLHGETLGAVARRAWGGGGALPVEIGARVVADAARGLHAAHELRREDGAPANVVHRDVSPENVFITYAGTAKVVDFGVARSNDQFHDRTATGELKGKLAYMSPEQLHDGRVDRRTDVWALGVVLWEITVGRRLFRRTTDVATVFAITRDPITRPSRLREGYPPALEAIVLRALERDPDRRYASANEFCRALETWLTAVGLPSGVGEVGEFMHALFSDQKSWRERYLLRAQGDAPFEDLIATWQSAAARISRVSEDDTEAMQGVPRVAREPNPAAGLSYIAPRPRDEYDATVRDPVRREEVDEAIPLTRRIPSSLPPRPSRISIERVPDELAESATPSEEPDAMEPDAMEPEAPMPDTAEPFVAPPRRRRWIDLVTAVGLLVFGALMVHIWLFDQPSPPRPHATRASSHRR